MKEERMRGWEEEEERANSTSNTAQWSRFPKAL